MHINVFSRTAAGRRSDESIEMQPLQGTSEARTPKGVLRRMPRVKSDDMNENGDENGRNMDKVPSPIGAGLPLLQRLRLLKEKQVRIFIQYLYQTFSFFVCSLFISHDHLKTKFSIISIAFNVIFQRFSLCARKLLMF